MLDPEARRSTPISTLTVVAGLAIAAGVLLFVIPLALRSMTLADEGYLLLQSLEVAKGKVLYRDLDAFVTPGVWFLLAGVFKLTEPSVFASRLPMILAFLALVGVAYSITVKLTSRGWGLATIAIMMACSVWAFPAWTFAFYSPLSVLFALGGLERLLAWRVSAKRRDLLLVGVLVGLSIAFKQNYGVFALAGIGLALIGLRLEAGESLLPAIGRATLDGLKLSVGIAAVALPVVAYFAYHGALGDAFYSLFIHPFEFSGKHDIPYMGLGDLFRSDLMRNNLDVMTYGAQPIYRTVPPGGWIDAFRLIERLHVLLYWIAPLIFIWGFVFAFDPAGPEGEEGQDDDGDGGRGDEKGAARGLDGGLFALLAVAGGLFLGVFPRADFNHLINVYQPVVVAGVVTIHRLVQRPIFTRRVASRVVMAVGGVTLALYFAVAAYWYHGLMIHLDYEVDGERGGVKVSAMEAVVVRFLVQSVNRMSEPGQALLTIPDIAMLNFLSDHPMPSAYYNLYEHHIAHDKGAGVAKGAEEHRVQVAITAYNNFFSDHVGLRDYAPALTEYLQTHFVQQVKMGRDDYILLERREHPVPAENAVSILEDCELKPTRSEIREHLLFDTLYQYPGVGTRLSEVRVPTRCRVRVPREGGELVMRVGYRHPERITRPSLLRVEVLAGRGDVWDGIFQHTFVVETKNPRIYRSQPYNRFRVDLSPYAGQEITLLLRTTRTGSVVMSPTEHRIFGAVWENPRIVPKRSPAEVVVDEVGVE